VPVTAVRTDKPQPYVQWIDKDLVRHMTVSMGARGEAEGQLMVGISSSDAQLTEGIPLLTASSGAVREGTRVKFTTVKP
jgi:hypothetical protein